MADNRIQLAKNNLSPLVSVTKDIGGLFMFPRKGSPCGVSVGPGRNAPAHETTGEMTMYRIYVLINRKKILMKKTRSYSNMQGFLADLRKRGFFCEVVYPRRGA